MCLSFSKAFSDGSSLFVTGGKATVLHEASVLEPILHLVDDYERKCNWSQALVFCGEALKSLPERDFLKKGDLYERLALISFHVAMQSENEKEFRAFCTSASENCRKAKVYFEELHKPSSVARILRCEALAEYLGFWLADGLSEKRKRIHKAWSITKQSLKIFQKAGDALEYGKAFNRLSASAGFACAFEQNHQDMRKIIEDALKCGEQAIELLTGCGAKPELARAFVVCAILYESKGHYFFDPRGREAYNRKSLEYMTRAVELSKKTAFVQLLEFVPLSPIGFWGVGTDKTLEYLSQALRYGRETKDRFVIGCALDWLAFNTFWRARVAEDCEERLALAKKALRFAQEARKQYSPLNFVSPRGYSFCIETAAADIYLETAVHETKMQRKCELLRKAVEVARSGVKRATLSGFPGLVWSTENVLSNALISLAKVEFNVDRKRILLSEALELGNNVVRLVKQRMPFHYYDLGVMLNCLVGIKCELVEMTDDKESKKNILQAALRDKETVLELIAKYVGFYEKAGSLPLVSFLATFEMEHGDILNRSYELTQDKDQLRKAAEAYAAGAESFRKLSLMGRTAECFWKNALAYDHLSEFLKAAECFDLASDSYAVAGEKTPKLADFYRDHSFYMRAWSAIERARHHHRNQEYNLASEYFEKTAQIHKDLKRWSFLAPNYCAWAHLERAEELSCKGRTEDAVTSFREAADLFKQTNRSLGLPLNKIEDKDEKHMVAEVLKGTTLRCEYCAGRIAVEEAKILERKGKYGPSAACFDSAAATFEKIAPDLESNEDRNELRSIIDLCRAWAKMMLAEDKVMPELYVEAAELFERAGSNAIGKSSRLLMFGHSRFCRALEAGMKFIDTGRRVAYSKGAQYLKSAGRYYDMVGLGDMVEYCRATELLFEAHAHLGDAKKEVDPERRAQFYKLAQMTLQSSSGCYIKAKRPDKREHVLKLMENVKEEQQIALSMVQLLRAPPLVSAAAFPVPAPASESAAGLSRFERANIQAHLTAPEEAMVGEQLNVRLDAINVGRNFALLIRVDDLFPKGAKATVLDLRVIEGNGSLDMRGKRLEPLKVESIRLGMQPCEPGMFELSPQLVFADESGKFRTCRLEPIRVRIKSKMLFKFKIETAEKVLGLLTSAFLEDYLKQQVPLEESGWRTLMEIIKLGRLTRSSAYGSGRRHGSAVSELLRQGLAETRVFPGERGRGGNILKIRVCYEKEFVKQYIDQQIVKYLEGSVLSVFHFLADSFVEDYVRRKLSPEQSGWRTLVEVVNDGKATKWGMYGAGGGRGRLVSKLRNTGLVEMKKFPCERGRGGNILRMRVCHDKEVVRRYVNRLVAKT